LVERTKSQTFVGRYLPTRANKEYQTNAAALALYRPIRGMFACVIYPYDLVARTKSPFMNLSYPDWPRVDKAGSASTISRCFPCVQFRDVTEKVALLIFVAISPC
jgi:hypothetical protein